MRKTITIEGFFDYSYLGVIMQIPHYYEDEGEFCDCCEEQIKEGENIGTLHEDFCRKCYEAGGVYRILKSTYQDTEEYFQIINGIKQKYEKIFKPNT